MKREKDWKINNFYFDRAMSRYGSESVHHYHNAYEIYYLKDGECSYFINDHSYSVKAGDAVLIPQGVIHRTNYGNDPHSRLLINFGEEFIPVSLLGKASTMSHLHRSREIAKEIEAIFDKIEKEYQLSDEYTVDALKCYTGELLFLLLRNCSEEDSGGMFDGCGIVDDAIKYIRENYSKDIRLSSVAKQFSVSSEHLSRIFKKSTGFGFNEYVTALRLQKAEYMLKNEPGRSVGAIAYECGFNDGNYFSYKFKEAYGVSPTKIKSKRKK